ncbi:NAD(P)/FAD-dependent oxidoreductase [Aliamphritea ceti]|uniref:NAD(P)/FAD-dependent oxidoreductase n=1 Tax=Aliamphritea ceti TaxID=1524258 RepID=UPI0021C3243D|nr:FAD-binding oxidoreductase [Aliamphritea ceti]
MLSGVSAYPDSYYAASVEPQPQRSSLKGANEADVCIVGAGFSGLSAGLFLREQGYRVIVLESHQVGWGASGRNGGQLINGFNGGIEFLQEYFADSTMSIADLHLAGGDYLQQLMQRYQIDCDYRPGHVTVAYSRKHMQDLEAEAQLCQRYEIPGYQMLNAEQLKAYVGSEVYAGGLLDGRGGHLHPLKLALGEAAALESIGGQIYEQSSVVALEQQGSKQKVKTASGEVLADKVILCGNAYLGQLSKPLASRVMPAATQVMATEPLSEEQARTLLPANMCIADCRYILDYYRLSAGRRLLFGGGTVYGGVAPADIIGKLRPNMLKVFPQLNDVKIDYAWSGNIAITNNRHAQLGRLNDNLYFAHGYCGHGVNVTHLFGKILADAIGGETELFDRFSTVPWSGFPGGQRLRVPYSVAGSWWYGLRDRLGV